MKDNQVFQIVFGGSAFTNHEIPVKELTPYLISLSDFLEEANLVINDDKTKIQVNIKGTFKTGCFHIDFSLWHSLKDSFIHLFNSSEVTSVLNFLGLLGFTLSIPMGLIGFIKWLRNRKIKKIIPIKNQPNKMLVIVEDEESIEIENAVIKLYRNQKIRMSLDNFICESLSKEGYETISFKLQDEQEFRIITKQEAEYFKSPELDDEFLLEESSERVLQLISPSFKDANKWRFSDSTSSFYAVMEDKDFLQKVKDRNCLFGDNDLLRVKMRIKQTRNLKTGLKTEYIIEEILEHLQGGFQLNLPFEDGR